MVVVGEPHALHGRGGGRGPFISTCLRSRGFDGGQAAHRRYLEAPLQPRTRSQREFQPAATPAALCAIAKPGSLPVPCSPAALDSNAIV